jgi:hypothetical protein
MADISLTLYTNGFFGSDLKSPIQMRSLSVNNSVMNISRLGTFKAFVPNTSKHLASVKCAYDFHLHGSCIDHSLEF